MKSEKINESLNFIDNDLVCDYVAKRDQLLKKRARRRAFIGSGGLVACVCIVLGIVLFLQPPMPEQEPPEIMGSVIYGDTIKGTISFVDEKKNIGSSTSISGNALAPLPSFTFRTIVEARIIYVLPDEYYDPDYPIRGYRIVVLDVIDVLRGNGIPKQIFMKIFSPFDPKEFRQYDTFIFSLRQSGVENYMIINREQNRAEYFPHMYETANGQTIKYGSVIAFKNGVVSETLWGKDDPYIKRMLDSPDEYYFPASHNSTLDDVKSKIKEMMATNNYKVTPGSRYYDYMTADDFFCTDEAMSMYEYIDLSGKKTFFHEINITNNGIALKFVRIIDDAPTDELCLIDVWRDGTVKVVHENAYTESDIKSMPDIKAIFGNFDYNRLPDYDFEKDDFYLRKFSGYCWYEKKDGKVYGVIKFTWNFVYLGDDPDTIHFSSNPSKQYYVIYDSEGEAFCAKSDSEYYKFFM